MPTYNADRPNHRARLTREQLEKQFSTQELSVLGDAYTEWRETFHPEGAVLDRDLKYLINYVHRKGLGLTGTDLNVGDFERASYISRGKVIEEKPEPPRLVHSPDYLAFLARRDRAHTPREIRSARIREFLDQTGTKREDWSDKELNERLGLE